MGFIFNSLGAGEILLVLAAALLLFGAERLPGIARTLGRALNEVRRASNEISSEVMNRDLFPPPDQGSSEQGATNQRREIGEGKREG